MSFSTYAHAIHRSLLGAHQHLPIKLGQVHQLLSASLGHNSLASYQNAQPAEGLGQQIIVDRRRLLDRFNDFGLPGGLADEFLEHFKSAAMQTVHVHQSDYLKSLTDFVRDSIPNVPEVKAHVALIGARISFAEVDPINILMPLNVGTSILQVVSGTVELSTIQGRPHPTRKMSFDGCVTVPVHGRRCYGAFTLTGTLVDEFSYGALGLEYSYLPED